MNSQYHRQLATLLFIATVVLLAGVGLRDPWPADEPRFALIARDMLENGNWMFPRVGGVLYPDKPPLFFWTVAAFYGLTGSIKVSILLPGVVSGLLVLVLVSDLAKRLWGPQVAITCGAMLLTMVQFPLQMKSGQIDAFLCLWTTLGLYGLCRHLLLGPDWRWYGIAGVAMGLGIITKGVGFLPFLLLVPYVFLARNDWAVSKTRWSDKRWFLAPLFCLLVVELWLVPMIALSLTGDDPATGVYRNNILLTQTVTRYTNPWGHLHPPWYLFSNAIPWLWFPATLLLPWLACAWRRCYRERNASVVLIGAWALLVLLFFSLSAGKRSLYIFPAAPAFALVAGYCLADFLQRRRSIKRLAFATSCAIGALLVGFAIYIQLNPSWASQWVQDPLLASSMSNRVVIVAIAALASTLLFRIDKAPLGLAAAMAISWIGTATLIYPAIDDVRSGKRLISTVDARVTQGTTLALARWPEQFLLHMRRPVVHFGFRQDESTEVRDAAAWLVQDERRRLLIPEKSAQLCFETEPAQIVGVAHRKNWYLVDQRAVLEDCREPNRLLEHLVVYRPPFEASRYAVAVTQTRMPR